MMGALGQATSTTIRLDLDNELEDARFFTRAEVLAAIDASANWTLKKHDLGKIDENVAAKQALEAQEKENAERKRLGLPPRPAGAGGRGRQAQKFEQKDQGSVANVASVDRSRSRSRGPRASFKIPGPTAIAHVSRFSHYPLPRHSHASLYRFSSAHGQREMLTWQRPRLPLLAQAEALGCDAPSYPLSETLPSVCKLGWNRWIDSRNAVGVEKEKAGGTQERVATLNAASPFGGQTESESRMCFPRKVSISVSSNVPQILECFGVL